MLHVSHKFTTAVAAVVLSFSIMSSSACSYSVVINEEYSTATRRGVVKMLNSSVYIDQNGQSYGLRLGNESVNQQISDMYKKHRANDIVCMAIEFVGSEGAGVDGVGRPILTVDRIIYLDAIRCD